MFEYLVFVSSAIQLVGAFFYIKKTVKGETKPNRVTWLLWSIAPLIGTAAALSNGVGLAVIPVFMSGFCPFLILISSFVSPKSYWKLKTLDYICGICSVVALILWAITKNPEVAILFAILTDALAGAPTLIKGWKHPETETYTPFLAGIFGSLTAFAAMKTGSFSEYAFSAYIAFFNTLMLFALFRKKLFHQSHKTKTDT